VSQRVFSPAAIIVAAGSGERLGADQPKALVELAGIPLIVRAVRGMIQSRTARTVVVTAPASHVRDFTTLIADAVGPNPPVEISVVSGGSTRQESVLAGLRALPPGTTHVLVHDAARCTTPPSQISRVHAALKSGSQAVIPALAVTDTIKTVTASDGDESAQVTGTLDRSKLRAVQTPQGFEVEVLRRAHDADQVGGDATDDAALVEALGIRVDVVTGSQRAMKITTPDDLVRAELLLGEGQERDLAPIVPQTGIAVDVHPVNTGSDAPLCVAGLTWPEKPGLSGHSDGDVVAHAICDAVLSAAGLGDLGAHFGTSAPEYAGASGERFLRETAQLVRAEGFQIGNVAVQLIGPFPRLGDRRMEAQQVLSQALDAPVFLTATTTDGLGFVGRGDGLAALATALVYPTSS